MTEYRNNQRHKIDRILIANRGEIACRVIKTAKHMGLECIAIYSDADRDALHVGEAHEAWHVGGPAAKDSYLNAEKIIEIAKKSNADAIHPGYGFLSENTNFAKLCEKNKIVFIGPPVSAIKAMASKSEAKIIMEKAAVPLLTGYHGKDQSNEKIIAEADSIGYPLLIKAVSGGGGKGMRIVYHKSLLLENLAACQREALSSFNDDSILLEKYLPNPRHIEVQIFADKYGNFVHLFDRDCSIQRRHQKIIEEAPAPGLSQKTRKKMGDVAVAAAKAIGYQGAGTIEFLYDDGNFYFMEMNTRLQVEHPITEMITDVDLVEWQILIAGGLPLPCGQSDININGHAFEARIYAEDPANNFLPTSGTIDYLSMPATSPHTRIDLGVQPNDAIGIFYDPMIAKLIVWDRNRESALFHLQRALSQFHISGITTNIQFLHQLSDHHSFISGDIDTHFIETHGSELNKKSAILSEQLLIAAALIAMLTELHPNEGSPQDPYSPWNDASGWRLNENNYHIVRLTYQNTPYAITVNFQSDSFLIEINQKEYFAKGKIENSQLKLETQECQSRIVFFKKANKIVLFSNACPWEFETDKNASIQSENSIPVNLTAPMPGTIIAVLVSPGDQVSDGQALIVIEAMKMEHTINAHKKSLVSEIRYKVGDIVEEGAELILFEDEKQ